MQKKVVLHQAILMCVFSTHHRNQLITSVPLDYEEVKQYRLEACVTDLGGEIGSIDGSGSGLYIKYPTVYDLPQDHRDCIHVIVNVVDENDNAPMFEGGVDSYSFNVYEEQDADTSVGDVNVSRRLFCLPTFKIIFIVLIFNLL